MTAPRPNELMQEGIQLVRENRTDEAYNTFRQVVARDPNSEFGWIWVSVTSQDRAEKRAALERALEINPNSQHARDALRSLDAEIAKVGPTPPPPPFYPTAPARIGEAEINTAPQFGLPPDPDPLRANLIDNKKKPRAKKQKPVRGGAIMATVSDPTLVSRKPARRRSRPALFILAFIFALAIIAALLYVYFFRNPSQNQATVAGPADATTVAATTADTTTAPDTATTVTTVVATTSPATAAAVPTSATTATLATTTTALTSSPGASTTAGSSTTAPATTAAPTVGTVTLPAGVSQTAQIAKVLETARQSQATGDYATAIASYQAALQADPRNVPANLGLGNLYLTAPDASLPSGIKRYDEAVKAFQNVTQQAPNWPGGYALLGESLADGGQVKPAIAAYSKSLELDPNGPERWTALATLYEKDNQPDQARYARERAGIIKPTPTAAPTPTAIPTTQPPAPATQPPAPPKTQPPTPVPPRPVITPLPSPKK